MGLDVKTLLKLKKDENGSTDHSGGKELVFNAATRQLEEKWKSEIISKPSTLITITPEDAEMFASSLIIDEKSILDELHKGAYTFEARCIDNGDVYIFSEEHSECNLKGLICFQKLPDLIQENEIVILLTDGDKAELNSLSIDKKSYTVTAYLSEKNQLIELNVNIIPLAENLFSRTDGLYETGKISNRSVAIIGLGSGGSPIALELTKAGVMHFSLVDDDRLEVANIVRHICGVSDLGRYKTKAVKEAMLNKNPYAKIDTFEIKADLAHEEIITNIISKSDLVICATDNRESKILINRLCLKLNKVCIYGGAFRRAYGGQVLRVIPHETMCYACFLSLLPPAFTDDVEISNEQQALRISYSDRVVPVEPGLSTDILPIALFIVKLAILELLKGVDHSMQSLYEDFSCSLYLWINRRESQFCDLSPMGAETDNMSVMRWYGVKTEKDPKCLVCGDFDTFEENDIFGE